MVQQHHLIVFQSPVIEVLLGRNILSQCIVIAVTRSTSSLPGDREPTVRLAISESAAYRVRAFTQSGESEVCG